MELRSYQNNAIDLIKQSFATGHTAPILRLDCGAGKTAIASYICHLFLTTDEFIRRGEQVLFLVHRQELLEQTKETFERLGFMDSHIKIGMVITVGNHLKDYNPDLIICDECNFALARSWKKVLNAYPNALKIGLSATPIRLSGEAMGDIFDDIIEVVDADYLIENNYLSKYKYYAPTLDVSLENVPKIAGDYDTSELEKILSKPHIYGDVMKTFEEKAHDRKVICYCSTINHSKEMAKRFQDRGYNAEHFDGTTPAGERKRIIRDFRDGKIQILCNVDLISYGFDVPDCDCVMLLRPTQSLALYIQQSMRCLRFREGKEAVILDFVANVHRFGLPTEHRQYFLSGKVKSNNPEGTPNVNCRVCRKCGQVYSTALKKCPHCGANVKTIRQRIKEVIDAIIIQIESINAVKPTQKKAVAKKRTGSRRRKQKSWVAILRSLTK